MKIGPPSPSLSFATSAPERRIVVSPQPSTTASSESVEETTYFGSSLYAAWSCESRHVGAKAS
jgi:hypothetical protein